MSRLGAPGYGKTVSAKPSRVAQRQFLQHGWRLRGPSIPDCNSRFPELGNVRGSDAIILGLKPEYSGDRVFAFGVGLAAWYFSRTTAKTEFYFTDTLDPQKLYNSARNIEIAAWKLANAHDSRGTQLIVSNEASVDA
jgi:hypothetical protein